MKHRKKNCNKGFTLVELIVVLVILAILAAVSVPALLGYIDRAKDSEVLQDAEYIMKAVQTKTIEAYAKGKLHINGKNSEIKTDGSNYPTLYDIGLLLEDRGGFGDPGGDYGWNGKQVVVNGFGNTKNVKVRGNKHFICQISDRGKILRLTYCNGKRMVTYTQEDGFVIEDTICQKGDKEQTTYNYLCVGDATTNDYNNIVKNYFFDKTKWR